MSLPLPGYWVRRLVWQPLFWLLCMWLLIFALPVFVTIVLILSFALPGKLRLLRLLGFALVYLAVELMLLPLGLFFWLASGFGRFIREPDWVEAHYRVISAALQILFWFGSRQFELTVTGDGPPLPGDDGNPITRERPLLVMSRHAGPGDSFLLIHEILSWSGRRPRIVLKDTLQLDPMIDLYLNRIPTQFVDPEGLRQGASLTAIRELAATMASGDALVIFPEGANATPRRRLRAIDRLRRSGRAAAADRAEKMHNVMPPRPGGVHAALAANDDLEVVVVAHTGLVQLDSLRDIWNELPMAKTLSLRWHVVDRSEIPPSLDGVADWLLGEWEQMDRWVSDQQSQPGRSAEIG